MYIAIVSANSLFVIIVLYLNLYLYMYLFPPMRMICFFPNKVESELGCNKLHIPKLSIFEHSAVIITGCRLIVKQTPRDTPYRYLIIQCVIASGVRIYFQTIKTRDIIRAGRRSVGHKSRAGTLKFGQDVLEDSLTMTGTHRI